MPDKIVVGYDGSDSAEATLTFAVNLAKTMGAELVVAHVLEWSPYSFLTPDEIEERHVRRKEELQRAEQHVLTPALAKLETSGLTVKTALKYGHIAETLSKIATEEGASQIVVGRTGDTGLSARIFGSVAGSLAQASPVPVTIVP